MFPRPRLAVCGMCARTLRTPAGATQAFAVMPITCRPKRSKEGLATLVHMSRQKRTAIMCAEAVPWRCHRSLVADALSVRGIPAVEILSESSYRMHKLRPFAQVEGTQITYPPEQFYDPRRLRR